MSFCVGGFDFLHTTIVHHVNFYEEEVVLKLNTCFWFAAVGGNLPGCTQNLRKKPDD